MDSQTIAAGGFIINMLLGGVLWFMRESYKDIKERQQKHEEELNKVKDTYFKKEDFREFKEELWTRLDRMEVNWTHQINELRK